MQIKVFTTNTCTQCALVKNFLKMKNLPFEEIDITEDAEKRSWLQNLTGYSTVPVTIGKGLLPIIGYNPGELSKLKEYA